MKRILTVLLCITFAIGNITVSAQSDEDISVDGKEITILKMIGVLPESGEYDSEKKITRAEFADYTAKFFGGTPNEKRKYYKDVSTDYWAADSINYLVEQGYLTIGTDAMFYPDRNITLSEACKILLSAAGYEAEAETRGGFPNGYMSIARNEKILPKVENANELTVGEAVELIYKAAETDIYTLEFSSGKTEYVKSGKETLFSKYHNIYSADGTITSVYGANLPGSAVADEDNVYIDYEQYTVAQGLQADDFFACYVKYVYRETDDDTFEVLYVENKKQKNDDVKINGSDIVDFDNGTYSVEYYRDSSQRSTKKETLPRGITVVYNGSQYTGGLSEIFDEFILKRTRGTVRILDVNQDGKKDTVVINSYRSFNVGYVNTDISEFYNKENSEDVLKIDDFDTVRIYDSEKNETVLTSAAPQVLSVAESKDKQYLEIITVSESKTGVLNSINITDSTVRIDGVDYDADYQVFNYTYRLNDTYTVKIDQFGYVVSISGDKNDFIIGYLTDIKYDSENEIIRFKIFEQSGKMSEYRIADKVKIDGVTRKSEKPVSVFEAIPGDDGLLGLRYNEFEDGGYKVYATRQIIRFKLNKNEEIKEIDTFYCNPEKEDKDNTLSRQLDGNTSYAFNWGMQSFGLSGVVWDRGKTLCFSVPTVNSNGKIVINGNEEDDSASYYAVNTLFDHDVVYNVEAYSFNADTIYADILVQRTDSEEDDGIPMVVGEITTELDNDDEAVNVIHGYLAGAEVKKPVDNSVSVDGIKCGDILRIITNSGSGNITKIIKVFDAETKAFVNTSSSNPNWYLCANPSAPQYNDLRNQKFNMVMGRVHKARNGYIDLSYSNGETNDFSMIVKSPVVVYDSAKRKDKVYVDSMGSVKDYAHTGSDCSLVVIPAKSAAPSCIVVYN